MFPKWLGPLVAVVTGIVAGGLIIWMIGVKAHTWTPASTGFWVF